MSCVESFCNSAVERWGMSCVESFCNSAVERGGMSCVESYSVLCVVKALEHIPQLSLWKATFQFED